MPDRKSPPKRFWFAVLATTLITYLLSYGPMLLGAMVVLPEPCEPVFSLVYQPAFWLFASGPEPLRSLYREYIFLWVPRC